MSDLFSTGIKRIVDDYIQQWSNDAELFLSCVGKYASIRSVLVQLYCILLKEGSCEAIESLQRKEKTDLYNEAKRISPGADVKQLIEVVKAVHAFGSYLIISHENQS